MPVSTRSAVCPITRALAFCWVCLGAHRTGHLKASRSQLDSTTLPPHVFAHGALRQRCALSRSLLQIVRTHSMQTFRDFANFSVHPYYVQLFSSSCAAERNSRTSSVHTRAPCGPSREILRTHHARHPWLAGIIRPPHSLQAPVCICLQHRALNERPRNRQDRRRTANESAKRTFKWPDFPLLGEHVPTTLHCNVAT